MSSPVRWLRLRSKILLSCVLFLVVALALQMVLFQQYSGQIIYAQARRMSESTLTNLQDDLHKLYKDTENSLIHVYANKQFVRDLSSGMPVSELARKYRALSYDLAYAAFDALQNLSALYLYTADHELISAYFHAQTPMYAYPMDIFDGSMDSNITAVQAYLASDESAMLVSGYHNPKRGANMIRHVLKLLSQDGRVVGYAVCDSGPKAYDALLEKYRYSEDQLIWLQRPGDQAILFCGGNPLKQAEYGKAAEDIRRGGDPILPSGYELFYAGQHKYLMNAYLLTPQSVLMENQSALNRVTIVVCGLIVALFSLLFMLVSRSLTHPLTRMVDTMNRIQAGEKKLRMAHTQRDELGQLSQAFNGMLEQIDLQSQREMQSQLMINDAKYKALQTQINPHFLYNTLDTMAGIASVQHADMAAALCRALSSMFRYSLDMSDTFASIADELRHLKNYMLIMDVRTQGSITLDVRIPQEIMDLKMPRLTLQPLVENAIQHGLKNKHGDKRVTIHAEQTDGALLVSVQDNGVGMDTERINQLLRSDDADALNKAGSIGLSNIHARLRLLFGTGSGLTVAEAPGGGSIVTLRLEGEYAVVKQGE